MARRRRHHNRRPAPYSRARARAARKTVHRARAGTAIERFGSGPHRNRTIPTRPSRRTHIQTGVRSALSNDLAVAGLALAVSVGAIAAPAGVGYLTTRHHERQARLNKQRGGRPPQRLGQARLNLMRSQAARKAARKRRRVQGRFA